MLTNAQVAAGFAAQISSDSGEQATITAELTALLDDWNHQTSTGGLAKLLSEQIARYDAKWSTGLTLSFEGVVTAIEDLPVDPEDGWAYWSTEAETGYPDGQLYVALDGIWVAQGNNLVKGETGDEGEPGPAGDSAYEVAVTNGFVGTQSEWLDSLNGADGEDGVDGVAPWGASAAWVTATAYSSVAPASVVRHEGSTYLCIESHTSGTFATDLAASKWAVLAGKGDPGAPGDPGDDGNDGDPGAPAPCVVTCVVTPSAGSDAAVIAGDGAAVIPIPAAYNGKNITAALAAVTTVSSSGNITIQVRRERAGSSVDMLSTPITILSSQKLSTAGGATQPVVNTSNDDVATSDLIWLDVDAAGSGAEGLIVTLTFA